MATVHPETTDFEHDSERVVYEQLASSLPEETSVFFSVPYMESPKKGLREGEVDFMNKRGADFHGRTPLSSISRLSSFYAYSPSNMSD